LLSRMFPTSDASDDGTGQGVSLSHRSHNITRLCTVTGNSATTIGKILHSSLMSHHGARLIRLFQVHNILFRQLDIYTICKQSSNYHRHVTQRTYHALIRSSSFSILVLPTIGAVTFVSDHARETCAMLMSRFLDISSTLVEST